MTFIVYSSRQIISKVTGAYASLPFSSIFSCSRSATTVSSKAFYATQTTTKIKMPLDLSKLGKNMVKKVPSMEQVPLESLWAEQTVVLTFLRRFGCLFCRQGAKDLSSLTPLLQSHGVKNIAVGLEDFGLDDFVKGEFFSGDLYVDIEKKSYKDIGYKRVGVIGSILSIFSKPGRENIARNRQENLESDLKGDKLQTGGTLVITKGGGEVLLDFRQDNPADHVELSEILKVLNIPPPGDGAAN